MSDLQKKIDAKLKKMSEKTEIKERNFSIAVDPEFVVEKKAKIKDIPIDKIVKSFDFQARKIFNQELISNLSDSMKDVGFLQNIVVVELENNEYSLVAGETRYKAAKKANFEYIPAFVFPKNTDMDSLIKISVLENHNRAKVSDYELFLLFMELKKRGTVKINADIYEYFGGAFSLSKIKKIMNYQQLHDEIIQDSEKGNNLNLNLVANIVAVLRKISRYEPMLPKEKIYQEYILPVYREIRDDPLTSARESVRKIKDILNRWKKQEDERIEWKNGKVIVAVKELEKEDIEDLKNLLHGFFKEKDEKKIPIS